MAQEKNIRFVAESTLGRLAKWLRILGFDTVYERQPPAVKNPEPDRIRLTRTQKVLRQDPPEHVIRITADGYTEQLGQVIRELGLTLADIAPFTRCIRCNASIQPIDNASVFGKVPDYIWETHDTFRCCPQCGRIYWPGSHPRQSLARIRNLFEE